MKDRISKYPGRVKLVPVEGESNTFDLIRADEPIEEGTALNKATLLKDETAALYGLDNSAEPNHVLGLLGMTRTPYYVFRVHVTYPDGSPAANVAVGGMTSLPGMNSTKTDSNGYVTGMASSKNPTFTLPSSYIDLKAVSKAASASGNVITDFELQYEANAGPLVATSSFSKTFSPAVKTVTYEAIGGGGPGGAADSNGTSVDGRPNSNSGSYAGGGGGSYSYTDNDTGYDTYYNGSGANGGGSAAFGKGSDTVSAGSGRTYGSGGGGVSGRAYSGLTVNSGSGANGAVILSWA